MMRVQARCPRGRGWGGAHPRGYGSLLQALLEPPVELRLDPVEQEEAEGDAQGQAIGAHLCRWVLKVWQRLGQLAAEPAVLLAVHHLCERPVDYLCPPCVHEGAPRTTDMMCRVQVDADVVRYMPCRLHAAYGLQDSALSQILGQLWHKYA